MDVRLYSRYVSGNGNQNAQTCNKMANEISSDP